MARCSRRVRQANAEGRGRETRGSGKTTARSKSRRLPGSPHCCCWRQGPGNCSELALVMGQLSRDETRTLGTVPASQHVRLEQVESHVFRGTKQRGGDGRQAGQDTKSSLESMTVVSQHGAAYGRRYGRRDPRYGRSALRRQRTACIGFAYRAGAARLRWSAAITATRGRTRVFMIRATMLRGQSGRRRSRDEQAVLGHVSAD